MMPKSSAFDAINQQLDALSLDELQLVRAFVVKRQKNLREEDRLLSSPEIEQLLVEEKSSLEEDDSLERIIKLVSEWMSDDSGYDETVLPEIKAGLDQNRFG